VTTPPDITIADDTLIVRFSGEHVISDAAGRVTEYIVMARDRKLRKLLIDASKASLVGERTKAAQYFRVQEWARAAEGAVRLAMVLPPVNIDPQRFGVTVAQNSGLIGEVFTSEADALEWLQRGQGAQHPVRKLPSQD
jgi:hypothetical protein